ncbi:MarR family transcriptional regulator [Streptacidiphilus pinicola]|uniref:MarR family transcriptional regulator n=1 Tax=Streptacidiphilus pinicola TaxID=2219663 RepID=A0A2X0IGA2_9ACTN|nr:MarR family transcriptional regulator [Streptacidiphilus pinicola]RAG82441.1 MarR family transcriptional regulator [Streptacidiphilus pinicola]
MANTVTRAPRATPGADEIQAFQRATRDLIGVALHSLEAAGGGISLPQMRMLLALGDLGRCPSSAVAKALGLGASSVTRLADRLVGSGHVLRGSDPHHRSVVTLQLSPLGQTLIDQVLAWRERELARILSRIDPALRAATADGLDALHHVVGEDYAADLHGPVPL